MAKDGNNFLYAIDHLEIFSDFKYVVEKDCLPVVLTSRYSCILYLNGLPSNQLRRKYDIGAQLGALLRSITKAVLN